MAKSELKVYRNKLIAKLRQLEASQRRDALKEGSAASGAVADSADLAVLYASLDLNYSLTEKESWLVRKIKQALERIDSGSYGYCQECGEKIARARLEALPWADLCRSCQEKLEAEEQQREAAEAANLLLQ